MLDHEGNVLNFERFNLEDRNMYCIIQYALQNYHHSNLHILLCTVVLSGKLMRLSDMNKSER